MMDIIEIDCFLVLVFVLTNFFLCGKYGLFLLALKSVNFDTFF